jgi:hypothetical protein
MKTLGKRLLRKLKFLDGVKICMVIKEMHTEEVIFNRLRPIQLANGIVFITIE